MHSVTIEPIYYLILHNYIATYRVRVGGWRYEVTGAGVTASRSCTFRLFSSCVPPVQKPLKCFKTSSSPFFWPAETPEDTAAHYTYTYTYTQQLHKLSLARGQRSDGSIAVV